jgi:hypothetical protein
MRQQLAKNGPCLGCVLAFENITPCRDPVTPEPLPNDSTELLPKTALSRIDL